MSLVFHSASTVELELLTTLAVLLSPSKSEFSPTMSPL